MKTKLGEKIWKIIDIIQWGRDYFAKKSFSSPRLLIELLLCKVLNCKRIDLYTNFDKPLSKNEIDELKALITLVLNYEPLQYVLGVTQFLDLNLKVAKGVFIPRPETEILVEIIRDELKYAIDENLEILDIGSGCGSISIALAKSFPNSKILTIDISDLALELTKENIAIHNIRNVTCRKLDILQQTPEEKFDLIVSNPPYIPISELENLEENVKKEPLEALTDFADGLTFYRRFAEIFNGILKQDGRFYLEIGFGQSNEIEKIFVNSGFRLKFYEDLQKVRRFVTNV